MKFQLIGGLSHYLEAFNHAFGDGEFLPTGCPVKSLHQCIWDGRHQALVGCGMLMTLKSLFPITFLLSVPLPKGAVKHKADQQCSARF